MKKLIFSFVLAVLMIASLLPATALAAVKSGTCGAEGDGSNLTWTLDSDEGRRCDQRDLRRHGRRPPVHPAGQKRDTRGGCKDPDDIPRDDDQVIPSMRMHPVNLTGCIFLPDGKHFSFFLPLRVVHYTVQFYQEVFFYAGKLYYLPG